MQHVNQVLCHEKLKENTKTAQRPHGTAPPLSLWFQHENGSACEVFELWPCPLGIGRNYLGVWQQPSAWRRPNIQFIRCLWLCHADRCTLAGPLPSRPLVDLYPIGCATLTNSIWTMAYNRGGEKM
jgi:hypothetical protein